LVENKTSKKKATKHTHAHNEGGDEEMVFRGGIGEERPGRCSTREHERVTAKMSNPRAWNATSGDAENQFRLQVFNKVKIMSQAKNQQQSQQQQQ